MTPHLVIAMTGSSPLLDQTLQHYSSFAMGFDTPLDVLSLVARFVVGFMFFWAGYTTLFRHDRRTIMHATLREAGIPLPLAQHLARVR